jgi:GNAT superfamily N-acetyltransferase
MSRYRIELLAKHNRDGFICGSTELDRYLRERATQDMRRRVASCFVAVDDDDAIAGFYTIAATSLALDQLPAGWSKRLPRYPVMPAVLLGRLAVADTHRGRGLGGLLVADAILRAARSEVMAHALVVDAKDQSAAEFYRHLGFEYVDDDGRRLIRALQTTSAN